MNKNTQSGNQEKVLYTPCDLYQKDDLHTFSLLRASLWEVELLWLTKQLSPTDYKKEDTGMHQDLFLSNRAAAPLKDKLMEENILCDYEILYSCNILTKETVDIAILKIAWTIPSQMLPLAMRFVATSLIVL